jgi:hypothetical protein
LRGFRTLFDFERASPGLSLEFPYAAFIATVEELPDINLNPVSAHRSFHDLKGV